MADWSSKDKKRKRQADAGDQPAKRALTNSRPVKISVQSSDEWTPIIASTNGLVLPPSLKFKSYIKPHNNVSNTKRSKPIESTELLLQSAEHPRLDYIGREEDVGQNAMLKHYVGVYDPETNELKLMDSKRVAINGTVREKDLTPDPQDQPSHWAMRQELGQQFGTKKAKKAIASLAENAISRGPKGSGTLDAAALALLETMEETTKDMSTREQLAEAAAAAKPRPQANKDAQDIKDVYTLDSLIGTETLKLITVSDWLEAVTKKEEIRTKSRFVANRLQKVGTAQQGVPNSEQIRIEKLKMLRYLLFLIEFHNLLRFDHGKASLPKREALRDLAGLPNAIIDAVKRKFCPSGSFMSRFQVDLLLTHMCALACVIDNFEVDTWDLKEDLNMDMKEMSKYFREIGAKITPFGEVKRKELKLEKAVAAQRRVAKLKLPLDFPRLPFTRKR